MVMGSAPQDPTTLGGRIRSGARRTWSWVSSPFTESRTRNLHMVEQLRGLDGRAQVHGTAIETISARVDELSHDQRDILKMLDRHRDMFERVAVSLDRLVTHAETASKVNAEAAQFAADIRTQLSGEAESVRARLAALPTTEQVHALIGEGALAQELVSTRVQLGDGLQKFQQALSEQSTQVHERLSTLPSSEQILALTDNSTVIKDIAYTRTQLANELQKVQQVLAVHTVGVHDQLSHLPSSDEIRVLVDGGALARDLAATKTQMAEELHKVHEALTEHASGLHERLVTLPSADHMQALVNNGSVAQQLALTKAQVADQLQSIQEALAAQTVSLHHRLAVMPSTEQVSSLVNGGTLAHELSSAWAQLVDGLQKVQEVVAAHTVGINDRMTKLPSTEEIHAVVNAGTLALELSSTKTQLANSVQKVHQVLAEHAAAVHDRLASLPSTEQVHALVEGGTANSIQSTRRLVSEEALRGQASADRMASKLAFLQSRSVIPLTAQGLVMCRNPLGFLAVPADDLSAIGSLADGVLPKPGALKIVEKYLKAGGTFVDVGAHVGLFSLMAARIVGTTGHVIAIEPAPVTANALRATVSANGMTNLVRIEVIAAGSERGLGTLSVEPTCGRSTLLASDTATSTVVTAIAPLDEILAGTIPDMVKIDVEGWEPKVIEGMQATLRANPNIILIMDFEPAHIRSSGLSAAAWVDRLLGAGLQIFEIDERNGELVPLRKNGLEEIVSISVLLARNDPSRRDGQSVSEGWLWGGDGGSILPAARAQD